MKKTRKPYVTEKRGKLYFRRTWQAGGKRREQYIPLPHDEDSEEFDQAYWAIRSGTSPALQKAPVTSWENLIQSYKASRAYRKLKPGTRAKYNEVLDALRVKNGKKDIRTVTRQQVRGIHEKYADTPRKADHYLQIIRLLLNFAKNELEWIEVNPALGIKLFGTQREFEPWPEAMQRAFLKACGGDEVMRTAFHLGTGTGQRAGDLCGMRWEHYDGEYISVAQDKTDARLWVYCPPQLKEHLDTLPKRGAYIMARNLTEPMTYAAIEARFRKVRGRLGEKGKGLVMHGWRYTAAVALAEAGCSDAEIQAVTGHKTLAMVQKYRSRASQKMLSKRAQQRRNRT